MSKWTKTRRDPGRTYQDKQEAKQLREELVVEAAMGNDEAESAYVGIINRVPGMEKEKRKELIKQFRDAVADHQRQRGR
jgi:hypothetical protein